jgi:DNA-binding transcriptional ArsR family regulator
LIVQIGIVVLKALSHAMWGKIVKALQIRIICVREIQGAIGVQPSISNHLRVLGGGGSFRFS